MPKSPQTLFRKGREKTGGRKKGTLNKKEVIKQQRLRAATERVEKLVSGVGVTPEQAVEIVKQEISSKKLGKDILSDFANSLAGMAAYHQPNPHGRNPNEHEEKFRAYSMMAITAAEKVAQYETPKLAAVMMGTAQTKKITVTGGLPPPDAPKPQLPPDMYDDHDVKPNGPTQRRTDDPVADIPPGASPVLSGNERK